MSTARQTLIAGLKSVKPRGWRIVGVDRNVDTTTDTTIVISQTEVASFPQAPIATVEVKFELTVTNPYEGRDAAEAKFDADIVTLLVAFRTLKVRFDPAVKVVDGNQLQYTVPVYVLAKKEN